MQPHYKHQLEAARLLYNNDVFALIMEQGTGKSRPVLDDWVERVKAGSVQDLVVFAPKGAYMNWIGDENEAGEVEKWIPPEIRAHMYIAPWISGAKAHQKQALKDLLHAKSPRFLAMNIEALNREGLAREYLQKFIDNHKVIGVIDESTTICHEEAARTKFILRQLSYRFKARRILSGLVAPESPLDLYTQYCYLDWKIIGQRTFWGFKNRYAIMKQVDFRPMAQRSLDEAKGKKPRAASVVVDYRNLEELNAKIMRYSYRVLKEDVLDIPPKIYKFYDVDLTEEQQRIYVEMRDIAMARLANDEFSTAKMKLDQLGKLQHILCGHVRKESGELEDIPENRTSAVADILHTHNGKAIIWAPYPQALRKIRDRLQDEFGPDSTVSFWGEIRQEERMEARARIQNDDACRFIVSNQSVGKFGNTWTSCNLVIYYANSFDNEDRQQSEDRPHRIGQTRAVTYIDLRARGTLDDKLIRVLRKKMSIAAEIQGDKMREWLI
jgi:helicase-like protein/SNF2 domain-containing protein